jgi:hypothetical protein
LYAIAPAGVFADPSPLVSKLMNTPASMFDVGMIRLQRELDTHPLYKGYRVRYDWDKNIFRIEKVYDQPIGCSTKKECSEKIKFEVEAFSGYWCQSESKKNYDCEMRNPASYFSHEGYSERKFYDNQSSEEAVKELRHNFLISYTLWVFLGRDFDSFAVISCQIYLTRDSSAKCNY